MGTSARIVYGAGPAWSPEEIQTLSELDRILAQAGFQTYLPHRDGIEDLFWKRAATLPPSQTDPLLSKAVFALEVYQIVERCQALVFVMNGRAPDEGGVFKAALAYATGKPLIIYKNDNRSLFHGNDNSMVTGITPAFATLNRLSKLPVELAKALAASPSPLGAPAHLRATLDLGRRIWDLVREHRASGAEVVFEHITSLRDELLRTPSERTQTPGIVYCSGALFCPEELAVMQTIAQTLEEANCQTFLPQRDGVEAFVMNQVDAPLSNAWILKPIQTLVNKSVFALDIYQIVERCDGFVFNMNGRVPDEGGVVETAVAYATGKPLVIYGNDQRSLAYGRPNPMIVSAAQAVVTDIRQIPAALAGCTPAPPGPIPLPPQVRRDVRFGHRVWKLLRPIRPLAPANALISSGNRT